MPALITHYEFIKSQAKQDKYFDILALAGQGPDPFFFYGYSLKKQKNVKEVRNFGTLLHHTNVAPVYEYMLTYALEKSESEREILLSFIKGFIFHYCLDRNAHPYIFYISGFSNIEKEKRKYSLEHAKIESYIDAIMYKKCKETKKTPKMIEVSDEHLHVISKMFAHLAKRYFKISYIKEDTYYLSVKNMRFVTRLMYSPFKIKKLFFHIFFNKHELNAMSGPLSLRKLKKYDIFNSSGQKWLNCVNGNIRFESFYELFNNAKKDAETVNNIMKQAASGLEVKDLLNNFVHNIDHDGFEIGATKKYFRLLLENKR